MSQLGAIQNWAVRYCSVQKHRGVNVVLINNRAKLVRRSGGPERCVTQLGRAWLRLSGVGGPPVGWRNYYRAQGDALAPSGYQQWPEGTGVGARVRARYVVWC